MRPASVDPAGLLQDALAIYREHFGVLFPLALIVGLVQAILGLALGEPDAEGVSTGAMVAIFVALIPTVVFLGFTVELVRDRRAGGEVRPTGDLLSAVLPIALPLLALALLAAIATIAGLLLLIVPGVILATIWAVVLPVYVIERPALMASFGRSRALVRGYGWPVLGTLALVALVALAGAIVAAILSVDPTSAVGGFVQLVIVSLVTPVTTLMLAGLYYRLVDLHGEPAPDAPRDPAADAFGAGRE